MALNTIKQTKQKQTKHESCLPLQYLIFKISLIIIDGDTIQFSYDTGNGGRVVDFKTSNALNDNQWHTVHVEKNRKQAWLRVDNFPEKYITESADEMSRTLDLKEGLVIGMFCIIIYSVVR
jgi:hypothetical protein